MKVQSLQHGVLIIVVGCLAPLVTMAQQSQATSIDLLKQQVAELTRIDRDPQTPSNVRSLNRGILEDRRSQLQTLLRQKVEALKNYESTVRSYLRPDEIEKIENLIRESEKDLQSLGEGALNSGLSAMRTVIPPAADREQPLAVTAASGSLVVVASNSAAPQAPCPSKNDDLIDKVFIVKGSPNRLKIMLKTPLSITQDSDVKVVGENLDIPENRIQIKTQHGSATPTIVPIKSGTFITRPGFGRTVLFADLPGALPPDDTDVKVSLKNLNFQCPNIDSATPVAMANKAGGIFDAKAANEQDKKAYEDANAAAKTPERKAFSAGFAVAKGQGKSAQGAGDLVTNFTIPKEKLQRTLLTIFDQADLSMQIKKSSAEKADPRYFNVGLIFRKTFLIFSPLRPPIASSPTQTPEQVAEDLEKRARGYKNKGFFRVLSVSGGLKLEGEAFDFKTVNFVTDPSVEIASIAKRLGSKGYYNFSIIGGTELGRNLGKPDASATGATAAALNQVNWIARVMGGGQFTLRYLPTSDTGDHWGVELNLAYVNRHLFHTEAFTDTTTSGGKTSKVSTIGRGNKPWKEANLKVFLFGDEKARYGFKFSYTNGSLPPAFTPTRSFQYGFVVETTDDKSNGKPANQ